MRRSSLLKVIFIFMAVARCMGDKCRLPSFHEYQNSTWDDFHRVNYWICPKYEGHAVVLCDQTPKEGQCYVMHIQKGQSCTNVDPEINKKASWISNLDGCTRVYDEPDCRGKGKTFIKNNGFDYWNLDSWDIKVSSVGLCSREETAEVYCHQANAEGRAECAKHRCYWLAKPNCGDNSTCGNDHFMWIGSQNMTCHGQTTKFCCPKSDGRDVILCQHFHLRGECTVVHIPKGETCANVDIDTNDWASSVHNLEGCIKVYEHRNCLNLIMEFNKNTDSYNVPQDRNDQISSVGICSPEDLMAEKCNRASAEGRLKCSPINILPPKPVKKTVGKP